jgi:hypothetical protein
VGRYCLIKHEKRRLMSDALQDFYPTPRTLIQRMLMPVNISDITSVLEPSAGKGDICEYIQEKYNKDLVVDVIEINQDLQHILRGKGYNLIHDDFLTFRTNKHYQLIVANFPFSDGDKHLQRAIDLVETYGGTLICLVNAETLRNPYTKLRQAIKTKLDTHAATIEYLPCEFEQAERQTTVEVALIRLTIPHEPRPSILLENLQQAETHHTQEHASTGIVEADFITSLVRRFDLECRAGIRLIEEYEALTPLMLKRIEKGDETDKYNSPALKLEVEGANEYHGNYVNAYLRAMRYKYWSVLLSDNRFQAFYTSNVTEDLSRQLDTLKECDFSLFNIRQLESDLRRNLLGGVEKAILDMFDEFSGKHAWSEELTGGNIHYYDGWKSNKAHKINNKIVLPVNGFRSWGGKTDNKLDTYYIQKRLADIVKVFNYLAGDLTGGIDTMVDSSVKNANAVAIFRNLNLHYFTATFYKKGTCHITFKD